MSGKLVVITGKNPGENRNLMQKYIDECNMESITQIPGDRMRNQHIIKNGVQLENLTNHINPNSDLMTLLDNNLVTDCQNIFIDNPEYELHSSHLFNLSQLLIKLCNNNHNVTIITYNEHLIRYLMIGAIDPNKISLNKLTEKMKYVIEPNNLIIYQNNMSIRTGYYSSSLIDWNVFSWMRDLYDLFNE